MKKEYRKIMNKKAFTLVELLVVISIIAMLLAVLIPALNKARDVAKQSVCMNNNRQLMLGWSLYCNANNDKLVFAGTSRVKRTGLKTLTWALTDGHPEISWVACPQYVGGDQAPDWYLKDTFFQDECVKMGTLYPYTSKAIKAYRCPAATAKDNSRSYAISSAMNGYVYSDGSNEAIKKAAARFEKIAQIKGTSDRLVLICQGGVFAENFGFECYSSFYTTRNWRDIPPVIHGKGTTLSFADGHSDYWKWEKNYIRGYAYDRETVPAGDKDFNRLFNAIWGTNAPSN